MLDIKKEELKESIEDYDIIIENIVKLTQEEWF